MCLAIPAKILDLKGNTATVDYGGVRKKVNVSLIEAPKKGDYVLIHAGFAIEKLTVRDAKESLKLIREYMKLSDAGRPSDG